MRWILLILFCLLGTSVHVVSILGVTTTMITDLTTESTLKPDIEQKKATYGVLVGVLDSGTSRKELINQLCTVAATSPAGPVPEIVPPVLVEE